MDYRKVATRVLYYSLGIAALSGVLAMTLPNAGEVIGRLIGTAIATAVGSAILLLAIQRYEAQTTRLFGAALGLLTLIVYFCTLIAIWVNLLRPFLGRSNLEEKFGLTALLFTGCGSLILAGLLFIHSKRLNLAGLVLSIIWAISLLGWLLNIWIFTKPASEQFLGNLLFPLQTLFPLFVLACIRRHIAYMAIALAFAISCCISSQVSMILTNGQLDLNLPLLHFILITGGIASILCIANVIQFRNQQYAIPWLEWLALAITSVAITVLCISIWHEVQGFSMPEMLLRLAVGTGILSSTAIIGLIVGQSLRSSVFAKFDGQGLDGICPRCKTELVIPRGKSACPTCGLRMKIQIESPKCRMCGYEIAKTPSTDSCSECGESIALP